MSQEEEYEEEAVDPALRNFNAPLEGVKHVGKGVIGGAVKGALIAGGIALALGAIVGGGAAIAAVGWIPFVGPLLAGVLAPLGVAAGGGLVAALGGALGAAVLGAKVGAAVGGGMSLLSVGEAIEEKKEILIEASDRKMMRADRMEQLAMRREQQALAMERQAQEMGVSPHIPHGRGRPSRGESGLTA